MTNKLEAMLRQYRMLEPGDRVFCALSGGADSVALTFGLYLLREKLGITLEAAHFNHHLRGEESDRDEQFVRSFCRQFDIPLTVAGAQVEPGPKGLEAAAREARYAFLRSLPGKVATAHTADDNAETLVMHMIRGTGLKGLGGIAPVSGQVIRPMLGVTRREVEAFLKEYALSHVEDSSNGSDAFLRNRIRHQIMPLLRQENPRIGENLSRTALHLRQDEACLSSLVPENPDIPALRDLDPAVRSRWCEAFLRENGVREPEDSHISLAESLIFSPRPSARASFPGGVTIGRSYDSLEVVPGDRTFAEQILPCPGTLELPALGLRVTCLPDRSPVRTYDRFTVSTEGPIRMGPRQPGDSIRLAGGRKSLKKLLIDRKIPAARRLQIPVLRDDRGILGVWGLGADLDRLSGDRSGTEIRFDPLETEIL